MNVLRNIIVGFSVSFIGSIPLGYLNIVGFEIYTKSGLNSTVLFLLGVVFIEMFFIYFTLLFAKKLLLNKKLIKFMDFFSIFFLFLLSYIFYSKGSQTEDNHLIFNKQLTYFPFFTGLFLSTINFLQLPFWMGWNLYLINGNYISIEKKLKFYYVAATFVGTFVGMLTLILILKALIQNTKNFSYYFFPIIIPLFFILMALFQMVKVYRKYTANAAKQ